MRLIGLWLLAIGTAGAADPFDVFLYRYEQDGVQYLETHIRVPERHFLYADQIVVEAEHASLETVLQPPAVEKEDPFSGELTRLYDRDLILRHRLIRPPSGELVVTIRWQGCNDQVCFLPQERKLGLPLGHPPAAVLQVGDSPATAGPATTGESVRFPWQVLLENFEERARTAGYRSVAEFTEFLDRAERAAPDARPPRTVWLVLLLTLTGGFALNLTPCVLPMIPVNLAIIGAGLRAASRRRGFLLGGIYGLSMALTYGALGLIVVLTGTRFGVLNASPWFNGAIAAIFVILGLAMIGVIHLDFSRFQPHTAPRRATGGWLACFMGAVSALLAGACVAPVVISVIVLASEWHASGNPLGLLLPFVLGIGMGLPWPFAGAGLAFLPKPGPWMSRVKYLFGVVIFGFAIYYGRLAWTTAQSVTRLNPDAENFAVAPSQEGTPADAEGEALTAALRRGLELHRPVVVDFWATWCKNCLAMDRTTLKDPAVIERLERIVFVKYQAEQPARPPARDVLDHFQVVGLPTYVLLVPRQ